MNFIRIKSAEPHVIQLTAFPSTDRLTLFPLYTAFMFPHFVRQMFEILNSLLAPSHVSSKQQTRETEANSFLAVLYSKPSDTKLTILSFIC